MADIMARDIRDRGILTSDDPQQRITFHITSLRNDSSQPINKEIVLRKLRTNLFNAFEGRVRILDRSAEGLDAVRAERAAKREQAVTANPNLRGSLAGSDFVLKGVIQDRAAIGRDLRSVYYLVNFELTDLETSELVWTQDYETKFESEKSPVYR